MTKTMSAYVAFQGGGALGMAHLGAWQEVSQKFHIIGTAGTSAGSIVAAFCAAEYTPGHAIDTFSQLNWSKYVNRQRFWKLVLKRDAYSDGKRFHQWLRGKLGANVGQPQDITFAELYKSKNIYLAIVACDLNSKSGDPVVFDKDKEPHTTVSFAVRASISIPGFFKPMSRRDRTQELVDGGVLLNFPVELLHSQSQEANCALVGVRFKQSLEYLESPKALEALKGTIDLMTRRGGLPPDNIAQDPNYINIEIDVSGFNFLKFDLANDQKAELVRRGAEAAKLALAKYEARIGQQVSAPQPIIIPDNPRFNELERPIHGDSAVYVKREPDESRCYQEILQPGALLRIKAPSQMGKTLLMSRILEHAAKQDYRTVALNLRDAMPEDFTNLAQFLKWFCTSVAVMLGLAHPVDEHWSRSLGNSKIKCRTYFEKYLLTENRVLVLALDEVDRLFRNEKIAGEFLGMLRTWHEDSKTRQLWTQLRLIVLHTEVYTELDINQSPFNAGTEIKLTDLSQKQVQNLAQQYRLDWDNDKVKQLMNMVGGHPYLVNKALEQVAQRDMTLEQLLETASNDAGIYRDYLRRHLKKLQQHPKLVRVLKEVVKAEAPVEFNSELNPDIAVKLDDLGLVKLQSNTAMPRYELYRHYFRTRL
ncbi:MAG: AAA-like domain-containing protein [Symplocastrum torsivum CPER-KK1]|uniref:AAA-like domain-containing protein n=1 Tax=Symplocastrum torsivum CPER-KK1 TaxID=450513 RepID=A0A951UDK7_9CYAN|nr:AAA-like domain-containing protein [Symplocastrum torsivum CPER-KK1]